LKLPLVFLPLGFITFFRRVLKSPCNPPYLGYLLCDSTLFSPVASWSLSHPLLKSLHSFFFTLTYINSLSSATLFLFVEVLLGVLSIKEMVTALTKNKPCNESKIPDAWHRIAAYQHIKQYRALSILVKVFNDCFRTSAFTFGLTAGFIIMVTNGYILVRLHAVFPRLFFGYIGISLIVLYAVIGYMVEKAGKVNTISSLVFHIHVTRNVVWRKEMSSLSRLKVKMGESNFVDRLTCLIYGSTIIENIISCVLVSAK